MQNEERPKRDLLTIGGASEYLGISIDTLRRWEKKGRIEPFRSPGGHRYFDKKTLDDLFGKRYTRDEPTRRRSLDETKATKASEVEEQKTSVEKPHETSLNEEVKTETGPSAPVIGLPHWRAIKEEFVKESIETYPPEPEILDRPAREVKIPQRTSIKVISSQAFLSPEEAYFRQQSMSVLTPANSLPVQINPVKSQEVSGLTSSLLPKFENLKIVSSQKKSVIYIAAFIVVTLLSIIWYLAWRNSQVVLSPVP